MIKIFTDGSSRGNPGNGGWGCVVCDGDNVYEIGGREEYTTNNRMELTGAIHALKDIKTNSSVVLYSDSQYLVKGMNEWISGWQRKNWINSQKKEVMNRDLWEELLKVSKGLKIEWRHVEGHGSNAGNNRCDEIATSFADNSPIELYKGNLKSYSIKLI